MPGPEEIPSATDQDYVSSRNPPILSTVFSTNFYGCKKSCIKSQLDLLYLIHECRGRNHCGKYRVLDSLPKRQRKWEKEEAWGLNAVFAVSFYKVTLYHRYAHSGGAHSLLGTLVEEMADGLADDSQSAQCTMLGTGYHYI